MSRFQQPGLYIHIPFCVSKCVYCDFLSFAAVPMHHGRLDSYVTALINELRTAHTTSLRDMLFDTVYIGGGTPTALPAPFLRDIIREALYFNLEKDAEITVEANPGTLSVEMLDMMRINGVTRLSIGLQAWQNPLLAMLGRAHKQADFVYNFQAAKAAGFTNINVDVMFALPGQSMADWVESLTRVAALAPTHISAYGLTPEEGTPLWQMLQNDEIKLPSEETDREMYAVCADMLKKYGLKQYELSNYARPGFESRHNTKYWQRVPYYGFGLGAHSFDGTMRWHNTESLERYINAEGLRLPREDVQILMPSEAMSEAMFLGLRLTKGVSECWFNTTFGRSLKSVYGDVINKLTAAGLLVCEEGYVRLTSRGMDLANQVFVEFVV